MQFQIDHDYHIHSKLSSCSNDAQQTKENILKYAQDNHLKEICITDHFWDERVLGTSAVEWYRPQNFEHLSSILPLPQSEEVRFYFGCETDMDQHMTIGISKERLEKFDFVIIPTTHMHMMIDPSIDNTADVIGARAKVYIDRLDALLFEDLPFYKIGIAHLTCPLMAPNWRWDWQAHLKILDRISDTEYRRMFEGIAQKGAGFELNFDLAQYAEEDKERVLRPYRIAKDVGCKFYLGSDAHHPEEFTEAKRRFEEIVAALKLEEEDKFCFKARQ